MLKPVWIVGFTGHRPGEGPGRSAESLRACRDSVRKVLTHLSEKSAAKGGTIELLTGVAAGADLEAAEVAGELEIPLHVMLPVPESMFERDFAGELASDWPRAMRLIEAAQAGRDGGTFRIAGGDNTRPDCYHEANLQMINSTDVIVAVWNGESADGVGGTGELIDEVKRLGKPYVVVDPVHQAATAFHGDWTDLPESDPILDELNQKVAGLKRPVARGPEERGGPGPAWHAFVALDEVAKHSGVDYRGRLIWSMRLHFIAALFAACTAAFSPVMHYRAEEVYQRSPLAEILHHFPEVLTSLEFLLVGVAFWLMWQAQRRGAHEIWRRTRFAAEAAHSLIMSAKLLDPLEPLIARHAPSWRRFSLTMSLLAHRATAEPADFDQLKAAYLQGRVLDQRDVYFRRELPRAQKRKWFYTQVSFWSASSAPIFIGVALVLKLFAGEWVETSYLVAGFAAFLPVALPLLAGAATSMIVATDVGRRAERYLAMAERLDRTARLMPGIKTRGALSRVVAETEETLLDELIEWYAVARNAGH